MLTETTSFVGGRRPKILVMGDTRAVGHHGSTLVMEAIVRELAIRDADAAIAGPVRSEFDVARLRTFDGVVINGVGALHVRSPKALLISQFARRARDIGIPCFLVNTVIDECDEEVIQGFPALTGVFCREPRSLERAKSYGAAAKLCPDVTLAIETPKDIKWHAGEKVIVTDSTLGSVNKLLHAFARRTHAAFLPMRTRPQVPIFSSKKAFMRIVKYEVRHKIGNVLPGNFTADRFGCAVGSADAFLRAIAGDTKFIVSGRFHGACLAMRLGVPFLAVRSITHKVESLLDDAQLSHKLIDLETLKSTTRLDSLFAAATWSDADQARCRNYVANAQKAVAACFDDVVAQIAVERARA